MTLHMITPSQLLFIFCLLLYQSVHLYIITQSSFAKQFRYVNAQTMAIIALAAISCYGWVQLIVWRRISYVLEFGTVWTALAIMIITLHLPKQINQKFILTQLLPTIIVAVLNFIKIVFIHQFMPDPAFNRLSYYSNFTPLFTLTRIILLPIFSTFISSQILIYLLISFQIVSTCHNIFYLSHYYPEAQWWNMVTQIWGWICLIKAIGNLNMNLAAQIISSGMTVWLLLIFCGLIFALCIWPSKKLVLLQKKVEHVLNRMKKTRNNDYQVIIMFYYACIYLKNQYNHFQDFWSSQFHLTIVLKLTQQDHKIGQYLSQIQKKKSISYNNLLSAIFAIQNADEIKMKKQRLIQYIKSKRLNNPTNIFQFTSRINYFICYFLLQTFPQNPKFIYQMFYRIKTKQQPNGTNNIFNNLQINNLFQIINRTVDKHNYTGTYIQDIMMLDQFYVILQKYLTNQKQYLALFINLPRYAQNLHTYLSTKVQLKKQLYSLLHSLQFVYPHFQTLILHKYVLQRYIENNEFLSKQNLVQNIKSNSMTKHKTKMLSFQINQNKNDLCVILCRWGNHDSGDIVRWNRNAEKTLDFARSKKGKFINGVKLKDLLPQFWRNQHENKFKNLFELNQKYEHDYQRTYYMCSQSKRYLQSKNLKVYPYFQLLSEMYFLIQTKIDPRKQLTIYHKKSLQKQNSQNPQNKSIQLALTNNNNTQNNLHSKYQISYMHQIYNKQYNTIDVTYKMVQVFGQQYIVQCKQQCLNLHTKQIIVQKNQNLNQDIQAVIQLSIINTNNKMQMLQKGKDKIDIFFDTKKPIVVKIVIICITLLVCIMLITHNFNSFSSLTIKHSRLQIRYHCIQINLVGFQLALQSFIRRYSSYYQPSFVQYLLQQKTRELENQFMIYLNLTKILAENQILLQILFTQYNSLDTFTDERTNNMMSHLNKFNTITDSSGNLLRYNKKDHWLLDAYKEHLQNTLQLKQQPQYIQNVVIDNIYKVVNQQINKNTYYYWVLLVITIVAVIVLLIVIVIGKRKIQQTLTKPLLANYQQLSFFRANIQSISCYIDKQIILQTNIVNQMNATFYQSMTSIKTSSLKHIKQSQQTLKPQKQKKQGNFFNHHIFLILMPILIGLIFTLCSKMAVNKNSFIPDLSDKIKRIQQFSKFNSNLFYMYQLVLQYNFNRYNMTGTQKFMQLNKIQQIRHQINQINVTHLINTIMIKQQKSIQILFGDPCLLTDLCKITNSTINPYPTQLNKFLSNFHNLLLLLKDDVAKQDIRYQNIILQTFISVLALSEIDSWIFNNNQEEILKIHFENRLLEVFSIAVFVAFVGLVFVEVGRVFMLGKVYGREIIGMFPSGPMCRSKAFQYEVNCILYRTNFAKELVYI